MQWWSGMEDKRILSACCHRQEALSSVFVSIHFPFLKLVCFAYFNSLFRLLEPRCRFINRASRLHVQSFVLALPHF